ncbi:MAG: hypothetical protein Q9168_006391, partial [Polycauliona sp. 1 TL-2023]
CTFPWLLANVLDPALGDNVALGNCEKTKILESSNGIKIGLIGLAEREWYVSSSLIRPLYGCRAWNIRTFFSSTYYPFLPPPGLKEMPGYTIFTICLTIYRLDTINSLPPNLIYKSASETAKALIPSLREQGADIIIALTHAREPSDVKLAEKTPPGLIDLILGGHDHFYGHQYINGTHILRSGTDFKNLSYIEAYSPSSPTEKWSYRITRRDITRSIPPSPRTLTLVSSLTSSLKSKLERPIGYTFTPLDARFTTVRTRESNLGNFICDLMRHTYSTECALMAGGTIRGDQVYPPGILRLKDIMNCFPFEDPVIVIRVSGSAILAALENSVSLLPALEGRYSQVSGIRFCYDPRLPPLERVKWVEIGGQPLEKGRKYSMATRGYMGRGKDGFTSLLVGSEGGEAEEIVSEENGILISMILRQYFMSLKVLGRWRQWGPSMGRHWGGVQAKLSSEEHGGQGLRGLENSGGGKGGGAHKHTLSGTVVKHDNGESKGSPRRGHEDSDDDDDDDDDDDAAAMVNGTTDSARFEAVEKEERAIYIARSVIRHWMRVAKIKSAGLIDDKQQEEETPDWTRGIAPRVEGRIVILGDGNEGNWDGEGGGV